MVQNNAMNVNQNTMSAKLNIARDLLGTTIVITGIAGLLYFGYFLLAPWIWSQSVPFKPEEIVSWQLPWLEERDGIELHALYAMMFLNLLLAHAISRKWSRLIGRPARFYFAMIFLAASCAFIGSIGFHPPMNTLAKHAASDVLAQSLTVMAVIFPTIILLYYLQKHSARWALAVGAIMLIPTCFIAAKPLSWYDYQHILAPALRLFHGAGVSEIYFQYDFLLSTIGLVWLKLQLDPNLFQVVGQCGYYLLLLSLFAFSMRWFIDKRLPVFLLAALILVRIYAEQGEFAPAFQVTPLRLDLWLILLMLVYFKGPRHWSAGLFCGLLLLLHHNFGIIYSAAYIQLLLTLCIIDIDKFQGGIIKTTSTTIRYFIKSNYRNFALMLIGAMAHYLLFSNADVQNEFSYIHLGINFIRIAPTSFYWYVVAMMGLSFSLLLRIRSQISTNYLAASFCLIYLAIGNSLYFFGRSHENNIINISAILLLLFFLLLDISGRFFACTPEKPTIPFAYRNFGAIASLALIASIAIWYGDRITGKAATQLSNAGKKQFVYPSKISEKSVMGVIAEVKSITGDSSKVYFADHYDFLLNYYGGYAPVGYYSPLETWVSKREFNSFLQKLLNQGYYLVIAYDVINYDEKDALAFLSPFNYKIIGKRLVAWK